MQAVQVFIPSELLTAGEAALVCGPDAAGVLDTANVVRGGRVVPISQKRPEVGLSANAPSGAAVHGREEPLVRVMTDPLGPGVHEFAFKTAHRDTGVVAGGISPTVKVYLETAPAEAIEVVSEESLIGGKLRFTFGRRAYS